MIIACCQKTIPAIAKVTTEAADNANDILDLIIELNDSKRTALLIVTHDLSIANMMDRKLELSNQRLIEV